MRKGKWLKQWKHIMLRKTDFDIYTINDMTRTAVLDYKDELSPGESVESIIEAQDEVAGYIKRGVVYI